MNKQTLEQVYYLKKELDMWVERRVELELDIAPPVKNIDGMPFANTNENHSPTEEKAIRLMECCKAIDNKISELKDAILEVEEYILSVPDAQMKLILEYRCIKCWSWRKVARKLGEGFTDESVRQMYHRFVKGLV